MSKPATIAIEKVVNATLEFVHSITHHGISKLRGQRSPDYIKGYQQCANDILDELAKWKSVL